ncbi:MAG: hypothetical protein ABW072_18915 [Sedimenticola sp.]
MNKNTTSPHDVIEIEYVSTYRELIEDLEKKKKFRSNIEVADFLGISSTALTKILNGGGIKPSTAVRLAVGLDKDPVRFLFESLVAQEKKPKTKEIYYSILSNLPSPLDQQKG